MQKARLLIAPFLNDNVAISGSRSPCGKSQQAFSSLCQLQIADQWQKIDKLTRQVSKLNDRLAAAEGDLHTVLPQDRPPPHY